MNWTTEKPTKTGWYWYRDGINSSPEITRALVGRDSNPVFYFASDDCYVKADELDGQFAGPIPEPTEPPSMAEIEAALLKATPSFREGPNRYLSGTGECQTEATSI